MTRLYGRAFKGERVNDYVPDVRFQRTSVLSTIRLDGTQIPFVFNGTLNGDLFKEYVCKLLAPSLSKGDIVIMDNSSVHKAKGVLKGIEDKGATVLFLPPYSPDLNPIELMWAKMKSKVREIKPRNTNDLIEALNIALENVNQKDVRNWFKHNGYGS